jgi:hypothetical protein
MALVEYAESVVVSQQPRETHGLRELFIGKRLHSVQRGQRLHRKHQPAKSKRIILRALNRSKVARMGDETSQDFERHTLNAMPAAPRRLRARGAVGALLPDDAVERQRA